MSDLLRFEICKLENLCDVVYIDALKLALGCRVAVEAKIVNFVIEACVTRRIKILYFFP